MQGMGILFGGIVGIVVASIFEKTYPADTYLGKPLTYVPQQADYVWPIILMVGAIPAALTYYWRMKMPETARYTALVARNAKQAASDMSKIRNNSRREMQVRQDEFVEECLRTLAQAERQSIEAEH
uniref:Uncharacterized protein n=1 Tax=Quercus lobata TaxID=97700 RepID=A0A7N2LVY5_QUELO